MPDRQSYSTRARKYISDFLEDRGENTASAADIINYLRAKGISVDPATVYRCLNRLCSERLVLKITEEKNEEIDLSDSLAENGIAMSIYI